MKQQLKACYFVRDIQLPDMGGSTGNYVSDRSYRIELGDSGAVRISNKNVSLPKAQTITVPPTNIACYDDGYKYPDETKSEQKLLPKTVGA